MSSRTNLLALLLAMLAGSAQAADIANGSRLYAAHCVTCHGGQGVKAAPGSPSFERGQGMARPDFMLMEVTRTGRNAMPPFQGLLSNRDMLDIIAYLRTAP